MALSPVVGGTGGDNMVVCLQSGLPRGVWQKIEWQRSQGCGHQRPHFIPAFEKSNLED